MHCKVPLKTFLLALLILSSCSTTRQITQNNHQKDRIEDISETSNVEIFLHDGSSIYAKNIEISSDSASYLDIEKGTSMSVLVNDVEKIVYKRKAPIRGLFMGLLIGATLGGSVGLAGGDSPYFSRKDAALLLGYYSGMAGGFIGFFYGGLKNQKVIYEFPDN